MLENFESILHFSGHFEQVQFSVFSPAPSIVSAVGAIKEWGRKRWGGQMHRLDESLDWTDENMDMQTLTFFGTKLEGKIT